MKDEMNFNYVNKTYVKKIISSLIIFFILLNNIFYQTDFQFNQIVLCLAFIPLFLFLGLIRVKVNSWLLISAAFLITIYYFSILFSESSQEINRSIAYLAISGLFLLIYFYGKFLYFSRNWLSVYSATYILIALIIVLTGERAFINPNWIALTMFFVFFMVVRETKILFLFAGLAISFFIFESRGTSVVFLVSIMIYYSQMVFGERVTKIGYLFSYFVLIFILFYMIHSLSYQGEYMSDFIDSFSDRGLSGRENALIPGYKDFINSLFLGLGPASPGSYSNVLTGGTVHIHFGLLELVLKFSILALFVFSVLLYELVKRCSVKEFPMVGGAMMTVFFYNGLAPSHLGLNIFLLIIISKVMWGDKNKLVDMKSI